MDDRTNHRIRRYKIALKYIYESLPDEYKLPSDPKPFESYEERFERMKKENEFLGVLVDKFGLKVSE